MAGMGAAILAAVAGRPSLRISKFWVSLTSAINSGSALPISIARQFLLTPLLSMASSIFPLAEKHFFANVSKPLDTVIGGWQVATIFTWNSGLWMGVNPGLVQTRDPSIAASKRATFNIPGSSDRYREWFAGDFDPSTATNIQGTILPPAVRPAGPN